jgi:hypothetical protein
MTKLIQRRNKKTKRKRKSERERKRKRTKNPCARRKGVDGASGRNAFLYSDSDTNSEIVRIATKKMEESGLVEWPNARSAAKRSYGLSAIPIHTIPARLN